MSSIRCRTASWYCASSTFSRGWPRPCGPAAGARRRAGRSRSCRTGGPAGYGPAELAARIGEKLTVRVEDRVGPQAGLEGVGLGLGDLVELGAKVAAARERDIDGLLERQPAGGPSRPIFGPALAPGISSVPYEWGGRG